MKCAQKLFSGKPEIEMNKVRQKIKMLVPPISIVCGSDRC